MLTSLAVLVVAGWAAQALPAQPSSAQTEIHGTWTAELRGGQVFYQLRADNPDGGDSSFGQMAAVDDFAGLPANADRFTSDGTRFELRREAGRFAFEGAFRDGRGAGLFSFVPRAEFAAEMKALGYGEPLSPWRTYKLAAHDVGPAYVRALREEGYTALPLEIVERSKTHGLGIAFIRELKALGFREPSLEALIRTRDHGVTPQFVRDLRALGVDAPDLEGWVRLRDHGVQPAYVTEMRKAGYGTLASEELVRARDHGVTADYVLDLKEAGLKDLPIQQLVRLRDHGITPGFINHAKTRGYTNLSPEELVRLKNRGFM